MVVDGVGDGAGVVVDGVGSGVGVVVDGVGVGFGLVTLVTVAVQSFSGLTVRVAVFLSAPKVTPSDSLKTPEVALSHRTLASGRFFSLMVTFVPTGSLSG